MTMNNIINLPLNNQMDDLFNPENFRVPAPDAPAELLIKEKKKKKSKKKQFTRDKYFTASFGGLIWLNNQLSTKDQLIIILRTKLAMDLGYGTLILTPEIRESLGMDRLRVNRAATFLKKKTDLCEVIFGDFGRTVWTQITLTKHAYLCLRDN